MRRLAAAVLAAVVNLLASMDADALVVNDDDRGDVEWRPSAAPAAPAPRTGFGAPIDGAWAVRRPTGQAAAVGLQHRGGFVDVIGLRVIGECPGWDELLAKAITSARQRGALKLIVESEGLPAEAVRSIVEPQGFQFSRSQRIEWVDVTEFYADLYRRPDASTDHGEW